MVNIVVTSVVIFIVSMIAFLGYAIFVEVNSDKIILNKNEWSCSASHKESSLVGKLIVTKDVCDNYIRVKV